LIVGFGLVVYFPLASLIPILLPDYSEAIFIIRIIFPSLIFTSSITAVKHNYFKLFNKNYDFLFIGLFVLLFSIIVNLITFFYFGTYLAITISSLLPLVLWYFLTEFYLVKYTSTKWNKNAILALVIPIFFYFLTFNFEPITGAIVYSLIIFFILIFSFKYSIIRIINNLKTKFKS
jgi:O-antigen/teichoic acid export membrane protein